MSTSFVSAHILYKCHSYYIKILWLDDKREVERSVCTLTSPADLNPRNSGGYMSGASLAASRNSLGVKS